MSQKGGKGGGKGFVPLIVGGVISLVMIGFVLALFKASGVTTFQGAFDLSKQKASEYSECIPAGECGPATILEDIQGTFKGDSNIIDGDGSSMSGDSSEGKFVVDLPEVGESDFSFGDSNFDESKVNREEEGYRGPKNDEAYVNDSGLLNKETSTSMLEKIGIKSKDKDDKDKDKDEKDEIEYSRSDWKHWTTSGDRSCWNTRSEILKRDAKPDSLKFVSKDKKATSESDEACIIGIPKEEDGRTTIETEGSGVWIGPYSGDKITDPREIDIDHIIPLSQAAKSGGHEWSAEKKEEFANDPDNLLATSASENRSKGGKGPSDYMPSNKSYHCQYAKSYLSLSYKYGLDLEEDDYEAIEKAIKSCDK